VRAMPCFDFPRPLAGFPQAQATEAGPCLTCRISRCSDQWFVSVYVVWSALSAAPQLS
jgi:hypothetical protein